MSLDDARPFWKCMLVKLASLWCKREPWRWCEMVKREEKLPRAHQSTALLWPLDWMISGARYSGVPHKVQVLQVEERKKKKKGKGIFMVNVERPVYNWKRALASCARTTDRTFPSLVQTIYSCYHLFRTAFRAKRPTDHNGRLSSQCSRPPLGKVPATITQTQTTTLHNHYHHIPVC